MNQSADIINRFPQQKILVVGDVMVDRYLFCDVSRISPEAPVPVALVKNERWYLGGAANVAANIQTMGGRCAIIGLIGDDEGGRRFVSLCESQGIECKDTVISPAKTIIKSRVIGGSQQLLRLDYEDKITNQREEEACARISSAAKDADLIIVSDYNKGFVTGKVMAALKSTGKRILVDPKPENFIHYNDVFLIKCNRVEAAAVTKKEDKGEESAEALGAELVKKTNSHILYTRGADGMSLFERGGAIKHIPSHAKEVYDVSGAGDTAMAALALSIASGATLVEGTIIANRAAGIKCAKMGTSPVMASEILAETGITHSKIKSWDEMSGILTRLRSEGKRIVFTNGCFDILHPGHTNLLARSRALGDALVLGLNTDESIRRLKGPTRPLVNEKDRAEVLAALSSVDYITYFDSDTPKDLIEKVVCPDVLVKGGDYKAQDVVGYDFVTNRGGRVVIVDLLEGKSTTNIVNKMR